MANLFKKVIDRQIWAQVAPAPNAAVAGICNASDLRSGQSRNPYVYNLISNTVLNRYNIVLKGWNALTSPALAGTFGAGTATAFAPSLGLVGTIAAGATTTSVILTTALPTAIGINMFASRGGTAEYGYKLRIIGATSGKTEERYIVGNTAGTTPTIQVLSAFTFTPASGDRYEIIAGRLFMLGAGTTASNIWRSLEVGTSTLSSGLTTTNLPVTIGTDSDIAVLDEQYVPYDSLPGDGMVRGAFQYDLGLEARFALTATATAAGTITGQAALGDATVVANEYRNFQIRIVQDLTNPTANGQRRIIASHTAGPSAVYTLGTAFTVTPSATAKFVIELPNLLLLRSSGVTTTFVYNYGDATVNNGTNNIVAGAWSTTYFGVAPAVNASGGVWMPSWGIRPDAGKNARQSNCFFFRGGAATLDVLDIANTITGTWTAAIMYDGTTSLTVGTCGCLAPFDNEGRMFYMNIYVGTAINQLFRFDVQNRILTPLTPTDFQQTGVAQIGKRIAAYCANDGADTYDVVLLQSHLSTVCQELLVLA